MSWKSGDIINTTARMRRLSESIPSSYTVWKDTSVSPAVYRAETNIAGGTDYSGADANTVIQAAIDALGTTGGKILFKTGIYTILNTFNLTGKRNIVLEGEFRSGEEGVYTPLKGVIFKLGNGANTRILEQIEEVPPITPHVFTVLRNLCFDGNKAEQTVTNELFYFYKLYNVIIENCMFINSKGLGGLFERCAVVKLYHNWFLYNDIHGLGITCCGNFELFDNHISDNLQNGIVFYSNTAAYPVEAMRLTNNMIEGNLNGISIEQGATGIAHDINLLGNEIVANYRHGLRTVGNVSRVWAIGNWFEDNSRESANTYDGANIANALNWIIEGNTFSRYMYATQHYGLYITAGNETIVQGNDFNGGFPNQHPASITLTNSIVRNNIGFVTESSGTSTGTGAQQTIAHGCNFTPTYDEVFLSERSTGLAIPYQSAAPDATNIYVFATLNKTYNWKVEKA